VPSTITLVLSRGAVATQMPDLMGRDVDAARQVLIQLGVRDVQIIYDPMALGARGVVVGQSPVPGATVAPGAAAQLRVAGEGAARP
jgi:beta-lactam-binding protein with PASTA domain